MALTVEQQQFLDALEDEFATRFSEKDLVYWEEHTSTPPDPPIVYPWYAKPRRRFDYTRRGRGGGGPFGGFDRSRTDGPSSSGHYDRDRSGDSRGYNRHNRDRNSSGYDRHRDRSPHRDNRGGRDRSGNRGSHGNYDRGDNYDRSAARDREYRPHRDRDRDSDPQHYQSSRR